MKKIEENAENGDKRGSDGHSQMHDARHAQAVMIKSKKQGKSQRKRDGMTVTPCDARHGSQDLIFPNRICIFPDLFQSNPTSLGTRLSNLVTI